MHRSVFYPFITPLMQMPSFRTERDASLSATQRRRANKRNKKLLRKPLNIKDELVILKKIGRGASGTVNLALHLPSMQVRALRKPC